MKRLRYSYSLLRIQKVDPESQLVPAKPSVLPSCTFWRWRRRADGVDPDGFRRRRLEQRPAVNGQLGGRGPQWDNVPLRLNQ
jgi:hypothetical protein